MAEIPNLALMHAGKASIRCSHQLKFKSSVCATAPTLVWFLYKKKDILLPHMRYFIGGWMALCFITYKSLFGGCLYGDFSDNL